MPRPSGLTQCQGQASRVRRYLPGVLPVADRNALLNADSERYPTWAATVATVWSASVSRSAATIIRSCVTKAATLIGVSRAKCRTKVALDIDAVAASRSRVQSRSEE